MGSSVTDTGTKETTCCGGKSIYHGSTAIGDVPRVGRGKGENKACITPNVVRADAGNDRVFG